MMRYNWLFLAGLVLSAPAFSGSGTGTEAVTSTETEVSSLFKKTQGIYESFTNFPLATKLGFKNLFPQVYVVNNKQQVVLLKPNNHSEEILGGLDQLSKNIHAFDLPEKTATSGADYQKLLALSDKLDLNDKSLHQSLLAEEPVIISLGLDEKLGCEPCNRVQKKLEEHAKALTAHYKLYHIVVEIQ